MNCHLVGMAGNQGEGRVTHSCNVCRQQCGLLSFPPSWGRLKVHGKIDGETCTSFFRFCESLHAKAEHRLWLSAGEVKEAGTGCCLSVCYCPSTRGQWSCSLAGEAWCGGQPELAWPASARCRWEVLWHIWETSGQGHRQPGQHWPTAGATSLVLSVGRDLLQCGEHLQFGYCLSSRIPVGLVALMAKNLLLLSGLTVATNVFLCLPPFFVTV